MAGIYAEHEEARVTDEGVIEIGTVSTWAQARRWVADHVVETVPLCEAVLCEDCQTISRRTMTRECAVCGSQATLDLAKILNREVKA